MLSYLSTVFATASNDLRFLTVKGEGKYQNMPTIQKLCAKIAKSYIIVRERNKKTNGYHFHVLMILDKEPHGSWFKKGVHMNLQKVGRMKTGYVIPMSGPTDKELFDAEVEGIITKDDVADVLQERVIENHIKMNKKLAHTCRILNYMSKEMEFPIQYVDYQIVYKSKNYELRPPETLPAGYAPSPSAGKVRDGAKAPSVS